MARRRPRRSRNRSRVKNQGLKAALCGVIVLFGAAGSYALWSSLGTARADEFGCFGEPISHTVMWLDYSPPRWGKSQARDIDTVFKRTWYDDLRFNERFTLVTTEGDRISSLGKERLRLCGTARTPGELEAVGAAIPQNGAFLTQERERRFKSKVAPVIDELLEETPPDARVRVGHSPILEAMQSISRRRDFSEELGGRRLIVVSDLVQNTTDVAKFCAVQGDLPSFAKFQARLAEKGLEPDSFDGAEVDLLLLLRYGLGGPDFPYCTERELREFWTDYFTAYGAAKVRVHRLLPDVDPI